ncbi:hypothetical protein [Mycobacterium sp. JS623]|uniref:hypothetical protein n=1 Tax=Mycobacterium sp. JS623 TaxID=212767 RepID=UPI0002E993A2|nr:hypothetical protein [Mycobacterium sp. JS623]
MAAPSQPSLTDAQTRLVLQFRAIRNSLGNFGRHGEAQFNVFMTPPHIDKGAKLLTFFEPGLPRETRSIVLRLSGGKRPTTFDVGDVDDYKWDVAITDTDVTSVEAVDAYGTPLSFGVPFGPKRAEPEPHTTTVIGEILPPGSGAEGNGEAQQYPDQDDRGGD